MSNRFDQDYLYFKTRMKHLAEKFTGLDPEIWGGDERLPAIFNEQLSHASKLRFPIRTQASLTGETATAAATFLTTTAKNKVLESLEEELDDADYLTAWEVMERISFSLALLEPIEKLKGNSEALAASLCGEMTTMPGADSMNSGEPLQEALHRFLSEWAESTHSATPEEARLLFLGGFSRHLLGAFSGPINYWEIFALKLENAIVGTSSSPSMTRLLSPVFRVLWNSLTLQPAFLKFCESLGELDENDTCAAERACVLAMLARSPGSYATTLKAAIIPEWFESVNSSLLAEKEAPWRTLLMNELEMGDYEPLLAACDFYTELSEKAGAISEAVAGLKAAFHKNAEDLAQGMQGQKTVEQFEQLQSELLLRSLWCASLSTNPSESRALFAASVVTELGLDPALGLWRKLSRVSSTLRQLIEPRNEALPWKRAGDLLQALEARAAEIKGYPIRWCDAIAPESFVGPSANNSEKQLKCARDSRFLLERIVVQARLESRKNALKSTLLWYSREVLPHLEHLPENNFLETWALLAESGFSSRPEFAELNTLAKEFGERLPTIIAAVKLEEKAEVIATGAADEVFAEIPEYAEKVGEAGRTSCIRDCMLTLRQISSLLLSGEESINETLSDWWNSAVGSYLATRPARLFETNINAIFHSLSRHLETNELEAAFTPLQEVYRENLGIECLEALTGAPTAIAGPLSRHYFAKGATTPPPLGSKFTELVCDQLAYMEVSAELDGHYLSNLFSEFYRALWSTGDSDTAAHRVLSLLADPRFSSQPEACLRALRSVIASDRFLDEDSSPGQGILAAETLDHFALAAGQREMATAMQENAPAIAKAYAEAMVEFDPKTYHHLSREEAVGKCMRDQSLLIRSLAQRLGKSGPRLFWIDASRWFLELLSPYVHYDVATWALSARTVAKHLGGQLSGPGEIFLARWVSQFEQLSAGWSASHALAQKVFTPTDYTFSAKDEEDRLQRDLVAAALTAAYAPEEGPWSGQAIFFRFLLSWEASSRPPEEVGVIIDNIMEVCGDHLGAPIKIWLHRVHSILEKVNQSEAENPLAWWAKASDLPQSQELEKSMHLVLADDLDELQGWRRLRMDANPTPDQIVAQAGFRAHLLHPFSAEAPRALASSFPAAARFRAGMALSLLDEPLDASIWPKTLEALLPSSAAPNALRSHFCTLELEWPAIQAGVQNGRRAFEISEEMEASLSSGKDVPYSQDDAAPCNQQTNTLAFAYTFRQVSHAVWDSASRAPQIFFGSASENHGRLPIAVAANAHSRTTGALRKTFPAHALTGDAIMAVEMDLFGRAGPLWKVLSLNPENPTPAYVTDLFSGIHGIAEDATRYAGAPPELADRLRYYLEALVCGLEESGDVESAWELLLERMHPDLSTIEGATLISAFYGTTRTLEKHLPAGAAIFWRSLLLETLEVVRQACLGSYLKSGAKEWATAYAELAHRDEPDRRAKCARDQEQLLSTVGHLLTTQAPVRALLNLGSYQVELILPHIKHSATEMAAAWSRHEHIISQAADPALRPAIWSWFGLLQRMARSLPSIRPLATDCLPTLAEKMATHFETPVKQWRSFLSALAAAAANPGTDFISGDATVEKLMLSSPLGHHSLVEDWQKVVAIIAEQAEEILPGRVPNTFKRTLMSLEKIAHRMKQLEEGKGSNFIRQCAAQAAHPSSRILWRASLLARVNKAEGFVESDPADTVAAEALNLPLEADNQLLAHFDAYRESLNMVPQLELEPAKQGFLSKIGLGRKGFDWLQSDALRVEGSYVLETLALFSATGKPVDSYQWYWACPQTLAHFSADHEAGTYEFYEAVNRSLQERLGSSHPTVAAMQSFVDALDHSFTGIKMLLASDQAHPLLGLTLLNLRDSEDAPAYLHLSQMPADRITEWSAALKSEGRPFSETQIKALERSLSDILRKTAA